jgi:hypothetical protein
MDAADLRELQAPLEQKYRDDPESVRTPMTAYADHPDPRVTATMQTWAGSIRSTGQGGTISNAASMRMASREPCVESHSRVRRTMLPTPGSLGPRPARFHTTRRANFQALLNDVDNGV